MLSKVAINKEMMNKFINLKRYDDARCYLNDVKEEIERIAKEKVDVYIENGIILEAERKDFIKAIEKYINKKLLEDSKYILVDDSYIDRIKDNLIKLKNSSIKRKKYNR